MICEQSNVSRVLDQPASVLDTNPNNFLSQLFLDQVFNGFAGMA